MPNRARTWTADLLPRLREALLELAGPEGEDRAPDDVLERLTGLFPAVGRGLVELMARDPSLRVSEQAALLLFYSARFAPGRLRTRALGSAAADLLEAMRDPTVPDERKYSMGPLLASLGTQLPDPEYAACFKDFEGTVERLSRDGMTSLLDSPEQLEALLAFHCLIGPDAEGVTEPALIEALERAIETLLHNAQVGIALVTVSAAICREKGLALEPALSALEVVARTKTPRAAWYLAELSRWPAMGDLGEKAKQLLEGGRDVVGGREPLGLGRAQPVGVFSHGLVSALDGEGSRDVVLFFRTSEGTFDGLALLLNERLGVLDVFASFGDGDDLERQARERFGAWAPCDLAFARELVADALGTHERTGRPVPGRFLLYRPFLGEAPLLPVSRKAELGAYALETIVPDPAIVEGSDALAEHEVYGDLGSTSDAAYAFTRSRRRRTLDGFLREVAVPERAILLVRLAAALEVEARAGRARRPVNRMAAKVYLALESELVPFDEVPYVRAVSRRSLLAVEKNVRKGFRSQAEASAAVAS